MRRAAISVTLAALTLCFGAPAAHADLPADAPTRGAFLKAHHAFEQRRAMAEYQKSRARNAAEDARVAGFLQGCLGHWNEQPDALPLVELERQGRLLYLAGCDDPLVQMFYG